MHGCELFQEGATTRSTGPMSTPWTYNTTSSLAPESSCRDEPRRPLPSRRHDAQPVASTSYTPLSRTTIIVLREVAPGILADGRMTDNHPCVTEYLNVLIRSYTAPAEQRLATFAHQELHGDPATGRPEDVGVLIGHPRMNARCCEAVFALAALKVLETVVHRAHQMLWNPVVRARTAETIERALRCSVYPLFCPENLWQGERSLALLEERHKNAMEAAAPPQPKTRRTRPAARTTRAATRAANVEQAPPAATAADKGKAVDRSTPARATRARAPKTTAPAPTRRSARRTATTKKSPLRQSTTAQEVVTLQAKAERMATPALATPAPEPVPNEAEEEVDVEAVERPAKRARTTKSAPSRASKRVAARATATTPAPAPASTPAPAPPSTPAPIPTIVLEGSATPEIPSPEDVLQPSRSSTAVGEEAGQDEAAGKKRKADDEPEPAPEPAPEDDGRRRKSSRAASRKRTVKAEALDAEKKAVKRARTRRR